MLRRVSAGKGTVITILVLQFIPLVLFPLASFSPKSQEWWLPALLALMVLIADVELIARHGSGVWPWYLMSFAHGFNIISRLMMIWPHATEMVNGVAVPNIPYNVLTVVAMLLSGWMLLYLDRPDVRVGLLRS